MDDLFQSLASAGPMNPTRDRTPMNRSGGDGTAFGAAFDSAIAATQRKDAATPPMGPPTPALSENAAGETDTDDIRAIGDVGTSARQMGGDATEFAQDQTGPHAVLSATTQGDIARLAFRFETAAPGSQDLSGFTRSGAPAKTDPVIGAPQVLPAPAPAGGSDEMVRSTASSPLLLPSGIEATSRIGNGLGSEASHPPQGPISVPSTDARKRPDAPDGRPLVLPAPFQQTPSIAAANGSGQRLAAAGRPAVAPLPTPETAHGSAPLVATRGTSPFPGSSTQTTTAPGATPIAEPPAMAILRSDLARHQTVQRATTPNTLAPDPSAHPTGRAPSVAQAAAPSAPPAAVQIPAAGSVSISAASLGFSAVAWPREDASPRVPPLQTDQPLRTGSWTAPATVHTPFSAAPAAFSSRLATAITPTESLPAIPMAGDPGPDLGLGPTAPLSTGTLAALPTMIGHSPPPMAQAAAQQIAAALADPARDKGAPLELALDPPELGRVRLQITELAGIMTLTIHAERPETADLMRRHLDLLAQEFAQSGLDAPSVRISQDGAGGGHSARPQPREDDTPTTPLPEAEAPPHIFGRTASGGLDLRL